MIIKNFRLILKTSLFYLMPITLLFFSCSLFSETIYAAGSDDKNIHLKLPKIFSDNMMLQRMKKIQIWGWSLPKDFITISFGTEEWKGYADSKGYWKIEIGPLYPGIPKNLMIKGNKESISIKNVLVGDVWLCSGQSNMEMQVNGFLKVNNYEQETAEANYPEIRFFSVPHKFSYKEENDCEGNGWLICNPDTVKDFSAVAYFFGRHIYKKVGVPIGLVCSAYGGTPVESWISSDAFSAIPEYKKQVKEIHRKEGKIEKLKEEYPKKLAEWENKIEEKDIGQKTSKKEWFNTDTDISDWKTMELPTVWESAGLPNFDGVVWFRKDIEIPESWIGKDLKLSLGPIDDKDKTYFNGVFIGGRDLWIDERNYEVPANLVKGGKNILVVRVLDTGGAGGIYGKPEQLKLEIKDNSLNEKAISLAGSWYYKIGLDLSGLPPKPQLPEYPGELTVLFNGMISPLIPYGIKGAIWYQGESNASNAYQYRSLFPMLIRDWRAQFKQGDFPFLFVQLANFMAINTEPVEDSWAELREAQLMTLSEPNTGMAVAIDIGEADDIHPKNKQYVGERLALAARSIAYGEKIVFSGPIYKKDSIKIDGNKIRISFEHIGSGLMIKGDTELKGFAIAAEDKKFVWAKAEIENDSVIVWSDSIQKPVAVRYAWSINPICNLYNKEGLPASPFRTDDWVGITQKKY